MNQAKAASMCLELELAEERKYAMIESVPCVVIVGGGFGGLAAAKALRKAAARIILIDRANHHLFQPLLYQVATSVLAPGQISYPIRGILRRQKNTTVIMGEVTGVDKDQRCVFVNSPDRDKVPVKYDYLILATGVRHSYFGHAEFEQFAPGLKGLADAVEIRNKVLRAFEQAEAEEDVSRHRELLTFVLVGGGPTGVELAAAIAVLARNSLRPEFRRIDPTSERIVLLDAAPRILSSFSESLSQAAKKRLEHLGVEVHPGHAADQIDEKGVIVAGERIASKTVIWTAGVAPSPAREVAGCRDRPCGASPSSNWSRVPGYPEIFVVGDIASLDQDGKPLPGVAQVAMQQGRYVGNLIRRRFAGKNGQCPFRYFDKGNMAVVGKGFAVLQSGKLRMSGFLAWLAWAAVHLEFLAQAGLRISVFVQWDWTFVTGQRGSRLIVDHAGPEPSKSIPAIAPSAAPASQPPVTAVAPANERSTRKTK
jgi:NADH:ubiquinone reductase (H+-translocating)